ncbi:cytochrome ubiquinol oxidase subunit I [Lichenihabitans psoromatis]|uniref:cytochrome ubiquinol oxidase subunit I n=1 Tax=Lichenihabitans psoromatis TaxID=2528642 RepID=UPI00103595CA|nr:cytochrome ubiquinol oxidase subunit I [Lichenihabitans psoromatis]
MFSLDALQLARIQFAFTVGFHIIFPAFSIGLAAYLMVLEAAWLRTRQQVYLDTYQYWLKIFAVVFGVGVVSGLVMSYEFGTNWSQFSYKVGPILGPLLGYETLTAFFLEAGFLGVMLFGMKRVGPGLHFAATCLVVIGTHISAAWILASNSWMQTPQGYRIVDGRYFPEDWVKIIFNPSYPYRFVHMLGATYVSVAFVVGAVGAYHLLRDRNNRSARLMFSMAMWMALVAAPLQIIAGDVQGDNTLQYQPQKVAAMEGDWQRQPAGEGEPLVLFALPDQANQKNNFEIAVPHVGSLYLTHSWAGTIKPLKEFKPDEIPFVPVVFFAFRIMVGLGLLMFAVGGVGLLLRRKGRIFQARWFQRIMVAMGPAGFIAMLAGWTVTEAGRQPFTVYGLLRTADSVSPVGAPGVGISLVAFVVIYAVVFSAAVIFLLRLMAVPPHPGESGPPAIPHRSAGITPGPAGATQEPALTPDLAPAE